MAMNKIIREIIDDSIDESRFICGSEGLYQCIIYNKARNHDAVEEVEREFKIKLNNGKVGYIDFVLTI
tara:strand:+ start:9953 stop:10156 length:204 start_codon:yes stop_codon:yes gene_type:complete